MNKQGDCYRMGLTHSWLRVKGRNHREGMDGRGCHMEQLGLNNRVKIRHRIHQVELTTGEPTKRTVKPADTASCMKQNIRKHQT